MILHLHNRYRVTGGEERVVEELIALTRERLGEPAELYARDSSTLRRSDAAAGLLRGGLRPREVARALARTRARVVHVHNLHPTFGPRALAVARQAGARVVLHLHQYRLVCAIGVCFTRGEDCTRCHSRNTLSGVRLRCRGSLGEALAYAAGLSLWQQRTVALADVFAVPSVFARERLRALGAPLPWERVHVLPPPLRHFAERSRAACGGYALVAARLAPEKSVEVAIDACQRARVPLVIAGDGPERQRLQAYARARQAGASAPAVSFLGRVSQERLAELRAHAALAIVSSRSETFSLAAAEAMAAGLPVAASDVGGIGEVVAPDSLAPPGDPAALATVIARLWQDEQAGARGLERARALCSPGAVAARLTALYGPAS